MKPVFLRFTDEIGETTKTFSACSLKTGMMDNIFDIAERAEAMQKAKGKIDMKEVRSFFADLKAIIVAVFGRQFTIDDLNENVEQAELMKVFNDLCGNLQGEMQKN